MQRILNHKILAFATLMIWLLASWSGAHGHLCFDGQEPPITVHIHTLGEHADHDSSENHLDADMEIGQLTPAKSLKMEFMLLLIAAFVLVLPLFKSALIVARYSQFHPASVTNFRPPLRAPPVVPV